MAAQSNKSNLKTDNQKKTLRHMNRVELLELLFAEVEKREKLEQENISLQLQLTELRKKAETTKKMESAVARLESIVSGNDTDYESTVQMRSYSEIPDTDQTESVYAAEPEHEEADVTEDALPEYEIDSMITDPEKKESAAYQEDIFAEEDISGQDESEAAEQECTEEAAEEAANEEAAVESGNDDLEPAKTNEARDRIKSSLDNLFQSL